MALPPMLRLGGMTSLALVAGLSLSLMSLMMATASHLQATDDRGSGRVTNDTLAIAPALTPEATLAIRGSGRLGTGEEEGLSGSSKAAFADILLAYRGSGRLDTDS